MGRDLALLPPNVSFTAAAPPPAPAPSPAAAAVGCADDDDYYDYDYWHSDQQWYHDSAGKIQHEFPRGRQRERRRERERERERASYRLATSCRFPTLTWAIIKQSTALSVKVRECLISCLVKTSLPRANNV